MQDICEIKNQALSIRSSRARFSEQLHLFSSNCMMLIFFIFSTTSVSLLLQTKQKLLCIHFFCIRIISVLLEVKAMLVQYEIIIFLDGNRSQLRSRDIGNCFCFQTIYVQYIMPIPTNVERIPLPIYPGCDFSNEYLSIFEHINSEGKDNECCAAIRA